MISVVMPVHNAGQYLRPALDSILRQTWRDFELLAIDDRSTDSSPAIIAEYAARDARVRLIQLEKNCGSAAARNRGIDRARGEFIALQDADDLSFPRRLEVQVEFLRQHPELTLIGTRSYIIGENGNPIAPASALFQPADVAREMALKKNRIHQGSTMFRAADGLRFREKFKIAQDLDLYLRLLAAGKQIANHPEILYQYRLSRTSVTSTRKLEQSFSAEAAMRFYQQRIRTGTDEYDNWDPETELPEFIRRAKNDLRLTDLEFNYRIGRLYQLYSSRVFHEALRETWELAVRYSLWRLGARWSAILAYVSLRSILGIAMCRAKAPGLDWPEQKESRIAHRELQKETDCRSISGA